MIKRKLKEYFRNNLKYYIVIAVMSVVFIATKSAKLTFLTMVIMAAIYAVIDIVMYIRSMK